MQKIYKNPVLYYLLIPVLVGLWPLLVWGVYLPRAERDRETEAHLCVEGQTRVDQIVEIDPERPNATGPNQVSTPFDYGRAVDQAANLCGIPSTNCDFTAAKIVVAGGKKRQDARVSLKEVTIVQAATFLSNMQRWVNLQCEYLKLTAKKGEKDKWDVDFRFLYYY